MRYKVQQVPGGYRATVWVPVQTKKGKAVMTFTGTASFREASRKVKRRIRQGAYGEVGFLNFKKIGRKIKKFTRSKALRRTFRKVKNTVKHPAFQAAVMAVNPALGTGLMTAVQAMDQADRLLNVATKGKGRKRIKARVLVNVAKQQAKSAAPNLLPAALPQMAMNPAMMNPEVQKKMLSYLSALMGPQQRKA